jgi:hypothetical protein
LTAIGHPRKEACLGDRRDTFTLTNASRDWLFAAYWIAESGERRVPILFQDISDRERAEAALNETDRLKDEVLATLDREMRKPLAPMQTGLVILKRSGNQPPTTANVTLMLELRGIARQC